MDRRGGTGADDDSIDTLYKAMEMSEPLPTLSPSPRPDDPPPPFVAVDPQQQQATGEQGGDEGGEEERAFIWVLLEFFRKRNWKKKLLT